MKRAKLLLPKGPNYIALDGRAAKLVDADTGQELQCCGEITLKIPIDGPILAQTDILISEIEVVDQADTFVKKA